MLILGQGVINIWVPQSNGSYYSLPMVYAYKLAVLLSAKVRTSNFQIPLKTQMFIIY